MINLYKLSALLLLLACEPKSESKSSELGPNQLETGEVAGNIDIDENAARNSNGGADPGLQLKSASIDTNFVSTGALAIGQYLMDVGFADSANILSMKYFLQSIRICQQTQEENPSAKCVNVYTFQEQNRPDFNYDTFGYCGAKAHDDRFVDILDPQEIKKLTSSVSVTEADIGSYKVGYVQWYRPLKVKAIVQLFDQAQTKLYTKDQPLELVRTGVDGWPRLVSKVDNFTAGPAEEAVVFLNNGGAAFHFATPLMITTQDIEQQTKFQLDLTFNPDKLVSGGNNGTGSIWGTAGSYPSNIRKNYTCPYDSAMPVSTPYGLPTAEEAPYAQMPGGSYSIYVPMIDLTPIVHRKEQRIVKETYVVHHQPGPNPSNPMDSPFDARIELYFLKDDPNRAIYGVSIRSYAVPTSSSVSDLKYARKAVLTSDNNLELYGDNNTLVFKDFKWLSTVGPAPAPLKYVAGNGSCFITADETCHTDPNWTMDVSMEYELTSRVELDAD